MWAYNVPMTAPIIWLLVIELIGFIFLPILFKIFAGSEDKGYCFSKPLGLATIGLATWMANLFIPFGTLIIWIYLILTLLTVGCGYIIFYYRDEILSYIQTRWKYLLACESVFLATYFIFLFVRYLHPAISHTEQPMDFAFLNAMLISDTGGPIDPWMKDANISYYYFGYWIFGNIGKLTAIRPEIAYNLSMATVPSLVAISVFGLSSTLLKKIPKLSTRFLFGIISVISAILLANLQGFMELLRQNMIGSSSFWNLVCIDGMTDDTTTVVDSWRPIDFWWWFKASRITNFFGNECNLKGLDYTITEFPFFSYLLRDLHPHVMSTPFLITFIALLFIITNGKQFARFNTTNILTCVISATCLFSATFSNLWNLPILVASLFAIFFLKILATDSKPDPKTLWMPAIILILSILFLTPYLYDFQTSASGIFTTQVKTGIGHGLIMWAPLFIVIMPSSLLHFWKSPISRRWKINILLAIGVAISPWIFSVFTTSTGPDFDTGIRGFTPLITILVFLCSLTTISVTLNKGFVPESLSLFLISSGLLLILIPEFIYIGDVYGNRMNTVFKLYYQAWIILSIPAGYSIFSLYSYIKGSSGLKKLALNLVMVITVIVVSMGLYYAPAAISARASESSHTTLNGLKFLKDENPKLYNAIMFARENISPKDGILEIVGEWGNYAQISSSTGIPNIINWPGHQIQWRGQSQEIEQRIEDVRVIYESNDHELTKRLLANYEVKYIYIGSSTNHNYSEVNLGKFNEIGDLVFGDQDGPRIYRIRE